MTQPHQLRLCTFTSLTHSNLCTYPRKHTRLLIQIHSRNELPHVADAVVRLAGFARQWARQWQQKVRAPPPPLLGNWITLSEHFVSGVQRPHTSTWRRGSSDETLVGVCELQLCFLLALRSPVRELFQSLDVYSTSKKQRDIPGSSSSSSNLLYFSLFCTV